jgi:cytochrome c biogenesis protein CcmG/thiol:disulfide interchange protein DsbE
MFKYLIPLFLFIGLAVFLALGLKLNPKDIPSPLIDKAAPAFVLPVLASPDKNLSVTDLKGQVWLFNVWASWCVSCRDEHPVLIQLSKHGNPYELSIMDKDGRTGIDYGVYGVPETFVIDKRGVIRYKHTGPVSPADVERVFLPLIQKLQAELV